MKKFNDLAHILNILTSFLSQVGDVFLNTLQATLYVHGYFLISSFSIYLFDKQVYKEMIFHFQGEK